VAAPPPTAMKILHLTTSSGGEGSGSSISSADFSSASAVMIDVGGMMSLGDERFQRQPSQLDAKSVSLVSAMPLSRSGKTQPTPPTRPRRAATDQTQSRAGRPRAAASRDLRGTVGDQTAAMTTGAERVTSTTCCSTSPTTSWERPSTATDTRHHRSRDLYDVTLSPRRRCRGGLRSFDAVVTQRCSRCRSTSGIVAHRKFCPDRKQFAADDDDDDDISRPVTMSTASLQHPTAGYINTAELL